MSRNTRSVNEDTSNLRSERAAVAEGEAPRPGSATPGDTGRAQRVPCVDPDPTDVVARRKREAKRLEHSAPALAAATEEPTPAAAVQPMPARADIEETPTTTPEVSVVAADADGHDLPIVLDANLQTCRQFVAGDVICDRFVVVDSLPGSGMGQVYKALDRQRDQTEAPSSYVALKFGQSPGEGPHPSPIRREFEILSRLSHPNIVKAFEIGSHNGADFMVMEWLEGQSLLAVLEGQSCKRMALRRAREIIRGVAAGLACAHEKGIVHGDVKPSNVFVTRRGTVKLLDFGAVAAPDDGPDWQSWATRAYASVDVLDGNAATRLDDVYSLGVTAYMLLSGERPFGTKDAVEARRESVEVPPLPQEASDLWPAVEAALAFDARRRPADAAHFLAEFVSLPATEPPAAPPPQESYFQYMVVATLVFAVTALWAFRLNDLPEVDTPAMLQNAQRALDEGRNTEPAGENALSYFKTVPATPPENPAARQGVDEIAGDFLAQAANALAVDDLEAAQSNLSAAARIAPGHPMIAIVQRLFDRYTTDLVASASLLAARDPARAAQMLDRAETLSDGEAALIAEIRGQMADRAIETELVDLFAGIDERILGERLAVPAGDSAIDLLNRARAIRPDDERVPLAANHIVSALLFRALFAISEGKLDRAEGFIVAAKSLDVRHLATARTDYELAKARDRVAAREYERAIGTSTQTLAAGEETDGKPEDAGN